MDINYIILAHKNPEQLKRLIESLQDNWVRFYIHIDRNISKEPFENHLKNIPNLYFLKDHERMPGIWGDIGIVEGTINAMKRIIQDNRKGYTILLSGQDYPLKNNLYIRRFFEKSSTSAYITLYPLPSTNIKGGGMERITKYKINKATSRGYFLLLSSLFEKDFYTKETLGKLNYLRKTGKWKELKKIFIKRKFPKNIKPYAGGVYCALSIKIIKKILAFIGSHPNYLEYHRYTLCADEIFFHSIIPYLQKNQSIKIERSLTYVNWNRPSGPLPVTFRIEDFTELKEASKDHLFARKFNAAIDKEVLDKIDTIFLT